MNRTERFYRIDQLLQQRRTVPIAVFLEELEVSRATFKRDLTYLRDRLHAPITWDRERRGYRFATPRGRGPRYALPGLWFSAAEAYALLAMDRLLADIEPHLLRAHIAPLRARIRALLDSGDHAADEVARRVRILAMAERRAEPRHFESVARALLDRRRLRIVHYSRGRDEECEREVSPQRLVHYRDTWYLDCWCHLRRGLRSFAVDGIREAVILRRRARNIAARRLDAEFAGSYGIFTGPARYRARLRFTPERARWVAAERWHPRQQARYAKDGSYLLEIPYGDDRELVMDILKHGAEVEGLGPARVRRRVAEAHAAAVALYR